MNREFVPFEFIDERGEYKGIAADYLALISEKTGLQFEIANFIEFLTQLKFAEIFKFCIYEIKANDRM